MEQWLNDLEKLMNERSVMGVLSGISYICRGRALNTKDSDGASILVRIAEEIGDIIGEVPIMDEIDLRLGDILKEKI